MWATGPSSAPGAGKRTFVLTGGVWSAPVLLKKPAGTSQPVDVDETVKANWEASALARVSRLGTSSPSGRKGAQRLGFKSQAAIVELSEEVCDGARQCWRVPSR